MKSSSTSESQHNAISQMLPWYANGTLDSSERSRVQQHVTQCSECQSALTVLDLTNRSVASEEIPVPPVNAGLDSVLLRIQQEDTGTATPSATPVHTRNDDQVSVWHQTGSWLQSLAAKLSNPYKLNNPQWAVAACAGVLAVALVLQQSLTTSSTPDATYTVLSSDQAPAATRFHIEFNQPVDLATAQSLLRQPLEIIEATVELSSIDDATFELAIPDSSLPREGNVERISQLLEHLQQHPQVSSAGLVP